MDPGPCTVDQRGGGYHRLKVKQNDKEAQLASPSLLRNPTRSLPSTGFLRTLNDNISCISGPAENLGLKHMGEAGDASLSLEKEAVVVGMPLI